MAKVPQLVVALAVVAMVLGGNDAAVLQLGTRGGGGGGIHRSHFPDDMVFGVSASAYQVANFILSPSHSNIFAAGKVATWLSHSHTLSHNARMRERRDSVASMIFEVLVVQLGLTSSHILTHSHIYNVTVHHQSSVLEVTRNWTGGVEISCAFIGFGSVFLNKKAEMTHHNMAV